MNSYLSIDDASDVTIGTTATNQSLVWNGSQWVNSYLTINDVTDVDISGATTGQRLEYNGVTGLLCPMMQTHWTELIVCSS